MPVQLPFADRPPSRGEVERIRLILSTYQDGTGMLPAEEGRTLPGWRDLERAVALALGGQAPESKRIFDVLLQRPENEGGRKSGLSCKMRGELRRLASDGRVTIEVSNSSRKMWAYLGQFGIHQRNYKKHPDEVGKRLVDLVHLWQQAESIEEGGDVDLDSSYYLVLSWNRKT